MKKQRRNTFTGILLAAAMALTAICPAAAAQTDEGASSEKENLVQYSIANSVGRQDYDKWSKPITSYLVPLDDGGLMNVYYGTQGTQHVLLASYCNADSQSLEKVRTIGLELPVFGGFYATNENYFVLTGRNNLEESPEKVVFRITKYDKEWNETGRAELKNCNTTKPFAFGTARMAAYGEDYLLIRTCRNMNKDVKGVNHQANLTIQLNIKTMEITSTGGAGSVSHSFNQFVKVEDSHMVTVDHGDAYPRGIIFAKYDGNLSSGSFGGCKTTRVLACKGAIGSIQTNATVGGFEISPSSYLIAGNSIDQSAENASVRNLFVAAVDKASGEVTLNWLTNYPEGTAPTTPHLVKITDDEYLVLWQIKGEADIIYCMKVNGKGECTEGNSGSEAAEGNSGNEAAEGNGGTAGAGPQANNLVKLPGNLSDCAPIITNASTSVSGSGLMWSTASTDSGKTNLNLYRINTDQLKGASTVSTSAITLVSTTENPPYPVSDVTTIVDTSSSSSDNEDNIGSATNGSTGNSSPSGSAGGIFGGTGSVTGTSTGQPFIKDSAGRQGWDAILASAEKAAAATDGGTVSIDMNGTSLVPGKVFANIKGKNVTLLFDMGKGIQWSVRGKDITAATASDINLSVKAGAGNIPQDVADSAAGGLKYLMLSLAHEGPFGFDITLSIKITGSSNGGIAAGNGTAGNYAGMYANLFYYNPALRSLEFISAGRIGEDGMVSLPFTHASDYIAIISAQPMGGTEDTNNPPEIQDEQKPEENTEIASVQLSKTVYTYNGKAKKPSVVAMDTDGRQISSRYYTVSYKNNQKVGKATATVTFKNGYSGTVKKSFTIRPAKTAIKKTTASRKGFTVKWKKNTAQTSGFQIQYSTNAKLKGKSTRSIFVKKASATHQAVKNLKAGKKYYVRIRTYKTVKVNGKRTKIYSAWSTAKTVRTLSAAAR